MPLLALQNLQQPFRMNFQSTQIIVVFSPTSQQCSAGMAAIQDIFTQTPTPNLKGHIVWAPLLPSDTPQAAYRQSGRLRDERLHHYWDIHKTLSAFFSTSLGLTPSPMGNIYMVFAPRTSWHNEQCPQPTFWMHQQPDRNQLRYLNFDRFNQAIQAVLEGTSDGEDCVATR